MVADINCFNDRGFPPSPTAWIQRGRRQLRHEDLDLVLGSRLYALTALELCNEDRA
jgi:hypothetical protein